MSATPARPQRDNLFGVCHAIGRTFGFNPLYLRLLFMLAMLANFPLAALCYVLSGLAVAIATAADKAAGRFARPALPAR